MSDFEVEFKLIEKEESQQEDEEEQDEKENERHRTMDYYNLYEFDYGDIEVKCFENKATERLKALKKEV